MRVRIENRSLYFVLFFSSHAVINAISVSIICQSRCSPTEYSRVTKHVGIRNVNSSNFLLRSSFFRATRSSQIQPARSRRQGSGASCRAPSWNKRVEATSNHIMSTSIPIQPQQVLPDWLSRSIVIISGHTSTETLQLPLTLTNYKGPPLAFPYTAVDSNGRGSGPTVYSVIGGSLVTVTLSLASPSTTFAPNSIPSTSVILIPSTTSATSRFSFVTSGRIVLYQSLDRYHGRSILILDAFGRRSNFYANKYP